MKMLVTKFSNGKYRNEGELFAEPISDENVKLMGEMIALQVMRTSMSFDFKVVEKLYNGLIKDLHHMNERGYIISDGYDYAQIAICFLLEYKGRYADDDYGKDSKGKVISIKKACYRKVDNILLHFRRRSAQLRQVEPTHNKENISDTRNYFENKQADYDKVDAILEGMRLDEIELAILNCIMNGMVQSQILAELDIGRGCLSHRKRGIRQKYEKYIDIN